MPLDIEGTIERQLTIHYPTAKDTLSFTLVMLSSYQQPCDVTFRTRPPLIGVKVDGKLATVAQKESSGPFSAWLKRLRVTRMLKNIHFSDGSSASLDDIWTINPMPTEGISADALAEVDLARADEAVGENGETSRDLIRATYRCTTRDQEDEILRRYFAS
jgi:hypothetical protein